LIYAWYDGANPVGWTNLRITKNCYGKMSFNNKLGLLETHFFWAIGLKSLKLHDFVKAYAEGDITCE